MSGHETLSAPEKRPDEPIIPESETDGQLSLEQEAPEQETMEQETPEQQARRLKRRKKLLHLLMIFLLLDAIAAGVLIAAIRSDRKQTEAVRDAQAKKAGVTQEMTEAEREERIDTLLGQAQSFVTMHSEMTAKDGVVAIYLTNEQGSPCAVELELMLMDSREVILRTGVVEPGWYLKDSLMNKKLPPGEYYCLGRCLFYTMDDNAYLGTAARHVLLTVK